MKTINTHTAQLLLDCCKTAQQMSAQQKALIERVAGLVDFNITDELQMGCIDDALWATPGPPANMLKQLINNCELTLAPGQQPLEEAEKKAYTLGHLQAAQSFWGQWFTTHGGFDADALAWDVGWSFTIHVSVDFLARWARRPWAEAREEVVVNERLYDSRDGIIELAIERGLKLT